MGKGGRFGMLFSGGRSHYAELGVSEEAGFKEVKDSYLLLSKRYHPDVSPQSHEQYQRIQTAYKVLINPDQRKKYDLSLGIAHSLWEKELTNKNFKHDFQSEAYDQLLKDVNKTREFTSQSIETKLQQDFQPQIQDFHMWKLLGNASFLAIMVGFTSLWMGWTTIELLVLNYKGSETHAVHIHHTDTTLKVVPLISR